MNFCEGQQIVVIDKEQLLGTLRTNRANHVSTYEAACNGYRRMAIDAIERMLKDARNGGMIATHVGLTPPRDHTRDYDRVIRALEFSVDSRAQLTEKQFAQYVMDDWEWRHDFVTLAASYSAYTR